MARFPNMKEIAAAALAAISFTAIWAVVQEQDLGWDLRNYHYYSVYAWLHDRVTYHIAPAQVQSWLNPLVFVPHYFLIHHVSPIVAGAVFGAVAGISILLVYLLSRLVVPRDRPFLAIAVSLLCAGVALSGPQVLEVVGTTSSDIVVSIPVLGALILLCWSHGPGLSSRRQNFGYFACGLLLGAASGLKLTCIIYALGLTASLLILWPWFRFSMRRFSLYSVGGVLGFLLTGGYWSWFLWREYGNPIFPYYNQTFHSAWAARSSFRDTRFLPDSAEAAIAYPFQWFAGLHPTSESEFSDARFALLTVLLAMTLVALAAEGLTRLRKSLEPHPRIPSFVGRDHFWLLVLFFVISYAIWMKTFAIQRYLMPLGLISGLVLFLALDRLLESSARKVAIFVALALFSITWNESYPSERVPYGQDWFGIELPQAVTEPDTLFVMTGDVPSSYVVPFLPESARVVRVSGNFPLEPTTELGRLALERITGHRGPLRSLAGGALEGTDRFQLARFGLSFTESDCVTIRSHMDQFTSCALAPSTLRPILGVDLRRRMVVWRVPGPASARVYVQADEDPRTLLAEGLQGEQEAAWLNPGHRYLFELVEWDGADGTNDEPVLARVTVDESGNLSEQTFDRGTIP